MTAAGIAFIAGGLATLISLRSVLFGGGKRRRARRAEAAAPPLRRSRPRRGPWPAAARPAAGSAAARSGSVVGFGGATAAVGRAAEQPPAGRISELATWPDRGRRPASSARERAAQRSWTLTPTADAGGPTHRRPSRWPGREARPRAPTRRRRHRRGRRPRDRRSRRADPVRPDGAPASPEPRRGHAGTTRRPARFRYAGWTAPTAATATGSPAGSGPSTTTTRPQSPSGEYWTPVPMGGLDFDLARGRPRAVGQGLRLADPGRAAPGGARLRAGHRFRPGPGPQRADRGRPDLAAGPATCGVQRPARGPSRNEKPAGNRFLENDAGAGPADELRRGRSALPPAGRRAGAPPSPAAAPSAPAARRRVREPARRRAAPLKRVAKLDGWPRRTPILTGRRSPRGA